MHHCVSGSKVSPQAPRLRSPLESTFEMKIVCRTYLSGHRKGLSRTSLIMGLFLWGAVFVSLYLMNKQKPDTPEGGSAVATDDSDPPIIIDKTKPGQSNASTARFDFATAPLPEFNLQNSEGGTFGLKDLKGKRWVASFVFSRCASTCPLITGAMMTVHNRVEGKADDVMFVTISVDPKFDTPEVFQKYAENYRQGDSSRWKFLTGSQQEIYELIVNHFGLVVSENLGQDRLAGFEVAHTNRVVLVNEDGIPVGTFLGTRAEDMVVLRRILTGKRDFPKPGPPRVAGAANKQADGMTFELVPKENESNDTVPSQTNQDNGKKNGHTTDSPTTDSPATDTPATDAPSQDSPSLDDSNSAQAPPAATPSNSQTLIQTSKPNFYLTTALAQQANGKASADSNQLIPENQQAEIPNKQPSIAPSEVDPKSTQTVVEFNAALQSRLPSWAQSLPTLNACLNSLATVLLVCGYVAIRRKKKIVHRNLMISAFVVSVIFLASYLSYHYALGKYTGEHGRRFEGTGIWASIYPWVLWPHVVLAAFVPVLALRVFQLAFRQDWERHRRLARITFPTWLYVSVTGVVIYGMLYHWPTA